MPDEEEPGAESSDAAEAEEEEAREAGHFGIDLGRRGDRAEQTSRDEVHPPPIERVKPAYRTLTERLASAAADRDDAASSAARRRRAERAEREESEEPED